MFARTSLLHRHKGTQAHVYTRAAGAFSEMLLCAVWAVEQCSRPAKRGRCIFVRTLRVRSVQARESGVMHLMQGESVRACMRACVRERERRKGRDGESWCACVCACVCPKLYTHMGLKHVPLRASCAASDERGPPWRELRALRDQPWFTED